MSHQPERKERDCLNCATIVQGRYCQACGQENIVNHQNFSSLARHFIYDIFHFDGKFFETLRSLFIRPGLVAKDYITGKRNSYLDPIRMYLFTSALMFLVIFSLGDFRIKVSASGNSLLDRAERMELAGSLYQKLKVNPRDSVAQMQIESLFDSTKQVRLTPIKETDSAQGISYNGKFYSFDVSKDTDAINTRLNSKGWFAQRLSSKFREFKQKYRYNYAEGANQILSVFLHRLPYLFFISLPFFAGILHLINIRRKNFFYSDHAVFTLYFYIFTFIIFLFYFILNYAGDKTGYDVFSWLAAILMVIWPIHYLISLKRFYSLSIGKAILKFILINFLVMVVLLVLFMVFILLSLFI